MGLCGVRVFDDRLLLACLRYSLIVIWTLENDDDYNGNDGDGDDNDDDDYDDDDDVTTSAS